MIQLYYSPHSCSMSTHIALEMMKEQYEAINTKELGEKYLEINPTGAVPAIQVDGGNIMSQNHALLNYLVKKNPESGINGDGSIEQDYEIQNWLSFVASDLHTSHGVVFIADKLVSDDKEESLAHVKNVGFGFIKSKLEILEKGLEGKTFLVGEKFSIADAYAFPVSRWYGMFFGQSMDEFPNIVAYQNRISEIDAVAKVLAVHNA